MTSLHSFFGFSLVFPCEAGKLRFSFLDLLYSPFPAHNSLFPRRDSFPIKPLCRACHFNCSSVPIPQYSQTTCKVTGRRPVTPLPKKWHALSCFRSSHNIAPAVHAMLRTTTPLGCLPSTVRRSSRPPRPPPFGFSTFRKSDSFIFRDFQA